MAKKKKSGSIAVPYLLTIFIGIIIVGGGTFFGLRHFGIIDGSDELPLPPKRQISTATYADNHSILFIYDEPERRNSTSFLLMRSVPKDKKLVFIGIPTNLIAIVDNEQQSMLSAYETGGTAGAMNFTNKVFGIEVDRYMKLNAEALIKISDILGGVSYPVGEDITGFNGDGSEQYLNSEQVERLITYTLYDGREVERAYVIGSVFSAMVNQNSGMRVSDNLDSSFKTVINMVDTDITNVDYQDSKVALKYMLENGNNIASFLVISGEDAYEDFIPSDSFFEDLRKKYYSYDESGKSDK